MYVRGHTHTHHPRLGLSSSALLVRECADPPLEVDPDTDEEESKMEDKTMQDKTMQVTKTNCETRHDPTTREWSSRDKGE